MPRRNNEIPKPLAWILIIGINIITSIFMIFFAYMFFIKDDDIVERARFSISEIEEVNNNQNVNMNSVTEDAVVYNESTNNRVENQINEPIEEIKLENKGEENSIYNTIRYGLLNGAETIDISDYEESKDPQIVFDLIERIVNENPSILYYKGAKFWSNGILNPQYFREKTVILTHRKVLENKIDSIINRIIKPDMSDYEKEKAVHDYIINNSQYDSFNLKRNTIPAESYTAYGVLVKGVGVCEGYSKAMKLFMDELGIECIIVSGRGKGQNHAWNLVKLDNDFYHVDVTWDDPVMNDDSNVLRYDYFNVTDSEMKREHSWVEKDYPKATTIKYNYHHYNNLAINSHDEFYNSIENALINDEKEIEMKILPYYDKKTYDVYKTVENIIMNNTNIRINSVGHSVNEELGIVNITFK